MSIRLKNILFISLLFLLVAWAFYSVFGGSNNFKASNPAIVSLFVARFLGLLTFVLMSFQMVLGSFHGKMIQILGAKAYRYHIVLGIIAFFTMFGHPLFYGLSTYFLTNNITDLLVLLPTVPQNRIDIYISLGRFAFYAFLTSISVAYLRKRFFRKNWKNIHYLNYLAYPIIYLHADELGADVESTFSIPFHFLTLAGFLAIGYKVFKIVSPHVLGNNKNSEQKV